MIRLLTPEGQLQPISGLPLTIEHRGQFYEIRATDRGRLVMFRVPRDVPVPRETLRPVEAPPTPERLALAALHNQAKEKS